MLNLKKLEVFVVFLDITHYMINYNKLNLIDSIVNSSGAITLEFTIAGDSDESSK